MIFKIKTYTVEDKLLINMCIIKKNKEMVLNYVDSDI